MIRKARKKGVPLTIETTHHYLSLLAEDVPDGATQFKCCPPVRDAANQVRSLFNTYSCLLFVPSKVVRIPESTGGKFFLCNPDSRECSLVESDMLGFRIRNSAQWIRNTSFTDKESWIRYLESEIHSVESWERTDQWPTFVWLHFLNFNRPAPKSEMSNEISGKLARNLKVGMERQSESFSLKNFTEELIHTTEYNFGKRRY